MRIASPNSLLLHCTSCSRSLCYRELTNTLFSSLRDDSVFYMVPDKLRRPLIFYFAHPAAVYMNKLVLAGLAREFRQFGCLDSEPDELRLQKT